MSAATHSTHSTTLRDYQARALVEARAHVRAGRRAILVVSPTGTGKTRMGAEFVMRHVERGGRVLWLAHRRELVTQARDRLVREGVPAASIRVVLAGQSLGRPDAPITVAGVQTILARKDTVGFPDASLVVFDEAHHYVAAQWGELAAHYAGAIRLGLTATPERGDGTPLGDIFDAIVDTGSIPWFVDEGHLTPCDVIAPASARKPLADTPLEAYQKHAAGSSAVVFCTNVPHSIETAAAFNAAGIAAAHVDGGTSARDRDQALAAFAEGRIRVLCNVYVLTEGWDCPSTQTCILARGCNAAGTYLQMVGRVLRPSPSTGKTRALLVDLRGIVHRHGLPTDPRAYSLDGKAGITRGDVERLEPITACAECGAVFRPTPKRLCPKCGAVLPGPKLPEVRPDRLVRVSGDAVASVEQQRAYFDVLVRNARGLGYKPGYVGHKFKARFGHWPPWRVVCDWEVKPANEPAVTESEVA